MIEITLPASMGVGSIRFSKDTVSGEPLPDRRVGDSGVILNYPPPASRRRGADAPGGVANPVNVPAGRWIYGFLSKFEHVPATEEIDRRSLARDAKLDDGPHVVLEFDGIDLTWFELRSADFDEFYPTDDGDHVDDQPETSFFHLYAGSTKESHARTGYEFHTRFHISHADMNRAHREAVDLLIGGRKRHYYISFRTEPEEIVEDGLLECGWYLLNITNEPDGVGLRALNFSADGTPERNWIVQYLSATDPVTQKRLHRVISADFVPDTDFNNRGGGSFVLVPPPPLRDNNQQQLKWDDLRKSKDPFEIPLLNFLRGFVRQRRPAHKRVRRDRNATSDKENIQPPNAGPRAPSYQDDGAAWPSRRSNLDDDDDAAVSGYEDDDV